MPKSGVPNVISGVVVGLATVPVNPFNGLTLKEVTVPLPVPPPPGVPFVTSVIRPFASTVISAAVYLPGITPVVESPNGLAKVPLPFKVASR
ncbi:hypothetical protein D3C86_1042220 [compost metagenome]